MKEVKIKKNRVLRRQIALQQVLSNSKPVIRPKCRFEDKACQDEILGKSQLQTWAEIYDRDTAFLNEALQRRAEMQKQAKPEPRKVYLAGPFLSGELRPDGGAQSPRLHAPEGSIGVLFYDKFYTKR